MCCEQIERQLGRYLDGELPREDRLEIEAHLAGCAGCRGELEELRDLARRIARSGVDLAPRALVRADDWKVENQQAPAYAARSRDGQPRAKADALLQSLWPRIRRRLDESAAPEAVPGQPRYRQPNPRRLRSAPWAVAAGILVALGLGLFGLSSLDGTARASTVDFRVLLDALPLDAHKAFRKFLMRYDARPTTPIAARRIAGHLNFDTPEVLPGGFRLQSVYRIRIGGSVGIAAAYDRDGEFLATVFHPPMKHERFGSHKNYPCVIGDHCGHKVQVGEWKLVHLTDPTTCHCLLSRLDEELEIPAVMAAVAPELTDSAASVPHEHP